CFFAGYLIRFRFDTSRILPDYVFALTQLPYYKEWVQAVQRAAGQPNINAWEYSNLQIPIPPLCVQETIIERLKMAYDTKRTKERQAYNFLENVDRLLLAELGITPKPAPPNTVENRIFKRPFSEVIGGRFDPIYHHGDIFAFVRAANCDLERLGNHVTTFQTGFAAGRNDQGDKEDGIIHIRPTNITEDRELIFRRNVYIAPSELGTRLFDRLKRHEVLFNNTNSQEQVGKTVYFDLEGDYFCSNHITRIATDGDRLNPKYLVYILNLYQRQKVFFKLCTNWNNQSGVGADVLSKITVPLSGLERQKQIVLRLDKIRADALALRRKAALELDEAKKYIEAMILGAGDK
ncbi:MAG: restriction endonuclease subunit S, partial [Deltaproteobacteria bacterium]|nr:restriction endonuclease subunit S [Deltaproteobacteria bacterium]